MIFVRFLKLFVRHVSTNEQEAMRGFLNRLAYICVEWRVKAVRWDSESSELRVV